MSLIITLWAHPLSHIPLTVCHPTHPISLSVRILWETLLKLRSATPTAFPSSTKPEFYQVGQARVITAFPAVLE